MQHDLPLVQGVVVYFTLIVIAINLVIDLAYTWLNPRVRTSMSAASPPERAFGRRPRAAVTESPRFARRLLRQPARARLPRLPRLLVLIAIVAPIVLPDVAHENAGDLLAVRQGPSGDHLLGTDPLGRDVLERLLVGTRVTMVGVAEALVVALALGVPLGLAAGFFGGWTDRIVSWLADLTFSMPAIVIILVVLSVFPQSMAGRHGHVRRDRRARR